MNQSCSPSVLTPRGNLYGFSFGGHSVRWGRNGASQSIHGQKRPYQVTFSASGTLSTEPDRMEIDRDSMVDDDPLTKRNRVEAVLLLSKSPTTTRKLAQLAHLADATEARTLVRDLNQTYDNHGRALRIELVAGGYRMLTRPALAPWLARLGHLPPAIRLSSPMMETLAVVAYRQTVSRADIEAVRGVACGELLRQLMERDLIRIAGRSEELGRPYLYGTTKRFLQLFGLPNLNALPPIRWQALEEDSSEDESNPEHVTEHPSSDDHAEDHDSSSTDSTTSPKEPVVSTVVAPVLPEADLELNPIVMTDAELAEPSTLDQQAESAPDPLDDPHAVIEDEEDDLYGDNDDDDDEDIDDMDDDDWDDEDDDLDDDDVDEDDLDEDDDWEEVDDDDELDDEEEEDLGDEEWDDDEEDDDEEWDEDDDDDDEEEEDWD